MGDYGLKVIQQGKNINSSEPREFIFNSKFGSVKIVQESPNQIAGEVTINGSATLNKVITHGLGFAPLCLVYAERTPGSGRFHFGVCYTSTQDRVTPVDVAGGSTKTYSDSSILNIQFVNNKSSSQTIKYYYYIFGDSG